MQARRLQAFVISIVLTVQSLSFAVPIETTALNLMPPLSRSTEGGNFETPVQEVRTALKKLSSLRGANRPWLYGDHLQEVFNRVGQKANLVSFLSKKQRILLQSDPNQIASELSLVSKKGYISNLKPPQFLVSGVQTYLMAFIITILALLKEDIGISNVTGKPITSAETLPPMIEAGEKMLLSVDMILSLCTASGLGLVATPITKPIIKFIESTKDNRILRNAFRNLLVNLVHSSVSFLGWEFGAKFLQESLNLLDDQLKTKEERKFLENRGQIFKHIYIALSNPTKVPPEKIAAARKVLSLIISNASNVLMLEDLRWQWIYNTYRLNLLNGNFFTILFSMAGGAALGNTLVPGAGIIWGSVFGLGGGALSVLVPEEIKYAMTLDLSGKSMAVNQNLHENGSANYFLSGFDEDRKSLRNSNLDFDWALQYRVNYREFAIDVFIERIHYSLAQMTITDEIFQKLKKAQDSTNQSRIAAEIEELNQKNQEHYLRIVSSLQGAIFLYLDEASFFNTLQKNRKLSAVQFELGEELINIELVYKHFCDLSRNLLLVAQNNFKSTRSQRVESIIRNTCSIADFQSVDNITRLSEKDAELYASALKFIETKYASRFSEQRLSLDRAEEVYSIKTKEK